MMAIELDTEELARDLPGRLTLFTDATSLGGVESLAGAQLGCPARACPIRRRPSDPAHARHAEWRRKWDPAMSATLVRISIGLESPADLIADLEQALSR